MAAAMKARLALIAWMLVSCGEDAANEDEPPRDAGVRKRDAAPDEGEPTGQAEEEDARVRDAGTPTRDAATRDAATPDGTTKDAGPHEDASTGDQETGRMVGMTAAHNAVRAKVETAMSLPPMTWSSELAAYAQEWADQLAKTECATPHHRTSAELQAKKYGENLAYYYTTAGGKLTDTAETATDGWAAEVDCYTYGAFMRGDACDTACYKKINSDGCGHYTQIVWRNSTEVGCGVATCTSAGRTADIWICNYNPFGNFIGQKPY